MSIALLIIGCAGACVSNPVLRAGAASGACADTSAADVQWVRAVAPDERQASARWCAGVGGPDEERGRQVAAVAAFPLTIVSWNTHVGAADIPALVADVRVGRLTGAPAASLILLLQEVYRSGSAVPAVPPAGSRFASKQDPAPPARPRRDIVSDAHALGLSLFYVPSMRNGAIREDRGSAILSSVALADDEALELPLERQRRVVVAASVRAGAADPVTIRLVSTHFTNMVAHHLWILSEPGRVRQARAVAQMVHGSGPTIVGGDLNSWFGYNDGAYRELARVLPSQRPADQRPTFGPLRLDHLLWRLPPGWHVDVRRANSRYGSDHYPLVATISTFK